MFGGRAIIAIGYGTDPFDFGNYTLTNRKELETYVDTNDIGTEYRIHIYAFYTPPTDEEIYEIGLIAQVRDVTGGIRKALVIRHVNPYGYLLYGGRQHLLEIIIVGR